MLTFFTGDFCARWARFSVEGLKDNGYYHLAEHSDNATFVLVGQAQRFISKGHLHRAVNSSLLHNFLRQ